MKTAKRLLILCSFFSIFILSLSAQGNYLPAYVIVNEADTLFGLVDFRIVKLNQETCLFKQDNKSPVVAYSPEDILAYRFTTTGKYYVSKTIEIDGISRKAFVDFQVEGMMNLYHYVDNDERQYFFFENENGELFSVTKNKSTVKDYQIKEDTKYDGIIRYQFRDYPPIAHYPEKMEFNQKQMIDIVRTYHNAVCTTGEECIVYENALPDKKGREFKCTIYAGVEHLLFKYDYNKQTIGRSMMIIGCEFDLSFPQLMKNLSLFADISVGKLGEPLVMDVLRNEKDYFSIYEKIEFNAYPLSIRPGLKYAYSVGRFSPMIKLAFSHKHFLGDFEVRKRPILIDDYPMPDISPLYDRNYSGFHVALGSDYKLKNGHSVFLNFFFDTYFKKEFEKKKPTLSDSFSSYGITASYIF